MSNPLSLIFAVAFSCLLATAACTNGGSDDSSASSTATAAVAAGTSTPARLTSERTIELGRQVAAQIRSGAAEPIWNRLNSTMREVIGSSEALANQLSTLTQAFGEQGARLTEKAERLAGANVYEATYRYGEVGGSVGIYVAFSDNEQIEGMSFESFGPAPTIYLDYETKTLLALPFRGEWFVFWGGRTQQQNYHVVAPDQRFAYDIVILREGETHAGD